MFRLSCLADSGPSFPNLGGVRRKRHERVYSGGDTQTNVLFHPTVVVFRTGAADTITPF